jgi:hypothetical protein
MSIINEILSLLPASENDAMPSPALFNLCKGAVDLKEVSTVLSVLYSSGKISRKECTTGRAKFAYWNQPSTQPNQPENTQPKNFLQTPKIEQDNGEWDEKRADIVGQNGNDGHHYPRRLNDVTPQEWDEAYRKHLDTIEAKLDEPAPPKEEPKPTPSTIKISLKREEIYTLTLNNVELKGMQKESEWEGLIKLKNATGSVILVSDATHLPPFEGTAFKWMEASEINYQIIKASPKIIELLKA